MQTSTQRRLVAASALLVGAALGIGFYMTRIGQPPSAAMVLRPKETAPATIVAAPVHPAQAVAAFAPALAPAPSRLCTSTSSTAAAAPTPEPLRRVLPSVHEAVADWRLFAPERLTVEAVPGAPVEFECVELKRGGPNGEFTIWIGRNADIPGASFVGVGSQDRWIGTQIVPGAHEYLLAVAGSEVTVIEKPDASCSTPLATPASQPGALPVAMAVSSAPVALAVDTPALSVDIVFFYGDDISNVLAGYVGSTGTVAELATQVATASVEQINQMLTQSGVTNFRWRLAGTEKVPAYTKKTTLEEELRAFLDTTVEPGRTVATRLTEIGADQGVFWLWDERSDFETVGGIANTPGRASVMYIYGHDVLLAHELAHNFGCRHDRQTSGERNEGARDGDGRYCYGYRFTRNGVDCGTIMSYAANRIPYYSNPDISVGADIYITGWTGTLPTGLPAADPRGADNARWLREQAPTLAATQELVTVPAIGTQPSNTIVTAGQALSLTVSATGGNLTYQWKKAGVDLAGATASTYTKYNAAVADAGSYTVTVRNNLGSVTSTPATVTVNPAPAPAPSSGGGSGGGGGLPLWFAAALVLGGAARRAARCRAGVRPASRP